MNRFVPALIGAALTYTFSRQILSFISRPASASASASEAEEELNFSIKDNKELIFSVKPKSLDQNQNQDYDYNKDCLTGVLIKKVNSEPYEFKFINRDRNNNTSAELKAKIKKIMFRLKLFDILQNEEYILVTIICTSRSSSRVGMHIDRTLFFDKAENQQLARGLLSEVQAPEFIMCEYKDPCVGAHYLHDDDNFRCLMDDTKILCFNNFLGEHSTPGGNLHDFKFREEGNSLINSTSEATRQIVSHHCSAIRPEFYNKYTDGVTIMTATATETETQVNISEILKKACAINAKTRTFTLSEYGASGDRPKYECGGGIKNKNSKHKIQTNKYKTNKYKTNKYKTNKNKYKK
jgi:hypothetical protein